MRGHFEPVVRRARSRRRRLRRRRGFTLMEVLLVLAILVILGSLVVANFSGVFASSKVKAAKAQLGAFKTQLDLYMLDLGSYPTTQQGLQALRTPPPDLANPAKWAGPYAKDDIPKDPWDNDYVYELLGPSQYRISSPGPDGQLGTDDDVVVTSG